MSNVCTHLEIDHILLSARKCNLSAGIYTDNGWDEAKGGLHVFKRWQRRSLSLRLVDDLWGWGGKRVAVKTCWCRWSMRLRREARAPHSLHKVEDAQWARAGGWFLEYVSPFFFTASFQLPMPRIFRLLLRAKTFLYEFICLFVPVTSCRRHSHRSLSALLTSPSQKTLGF